MLWSNVDLDVAIENLRDDQRHQVVLSEDAALVQMSALGAAEKAHAVQVVCAERWWWDADEIDRLQRERA